MTTQTNFPYNGLKQLLFSSEETLSSKQDLADLLVESGYEIPNEAELPEI